MKTRKKRLVVVVDMLNGFCKTGNLASPRFMQTIVPNVKKLLGAERKKRGYKIMFIGDAHHHDDKEFELFSEHCIVGTDEARVIEELAPQNLLDLTNGHTYSEINKRREIFVPKDHYSPFAQSWWGELLDAPYLNLVLNSWGIGPPNSYEVVIVGNCTDICIHYTALGFINFGFEVIIPADCVDTFNLTAADCEKLGLPESKIHLANEINKFFLERHFPNILGIRVVPTVDEILR